MSWVFRVNAGGIQHPEFGKGKCKESVADRVQSHIIRRNSNLLHCKSISMHHARRCTNVLSIWIQDSQKKLLQDYLPLPSFRPAWIEYLQARHQQIQDLLTSIQGWDTRKHVLFGKIPCFNSLKFFNPKCVAPVLPSKQLEQKWCLELIPAMGIAVKI